MKLLEGKENFNGFSLQRHERKAEAMRAVVQVFSDMFEDEIDLFWLSMKFMKCLDRCASQLDKLVTINLT